METGKLQLDDLAPRIKELKTRQEEFNKARIQIEAEMVVPGIEKIDKTVEFTEKKDFLQSFIKRIVVNEKQVTIQYNLPLATHGRLKAETEVLPIETYGRL